VRKHYATVRKDFSICRQHFAKDRYDFSACRYDFAIVRYYELVRCKKLMSVASSLQHPSKQATRKYNQVQYRYTKRLIKVL